MLHENIKRLRKAKGISRKDLAIRLNVERRTVSKWENALSAPDLSMLITLADKLDTSVSNLLGENVQEGFSVEENIKAISEKLEVINLNLAKRSESKNQTFHCLRNAICAIAVVICLHLGILVSIS